MPLSTLFKEANITLSSIKDINIKVGNLEDVMETVLNGHTHE
jgi:hypothetical protein